MTDARELCEKVVYEVGTCRDQIDFKNYSLYSILDIASRRKIAR